MTTFRSISAALLCVFSVACFDVSRVPGGPPVGYETNAEACNDGLDNDQDGYIDCRDPDCIQRNFCGEIIPGQPPSGFEGDLATCSDGIDNDEDGQFDCGDRGCQAIAETCCVGEFTDVLCSDGIDNDGNGFADCRDFACRNGAFVTVCDRETDCSNGIDDDGDGFTDCDDRDCTTNAACASMNEPENTEARCMDGIDNDGNGFTDCRDFSCCPRGMSCITPAVEQFCNAGREEENTEERCMDGIDNDGNGFTDCAEFACCPRGMSCITSAVQQYCDSIAENTYERCTDGIDNDGDGYIDCNDNSCLNVEHAEGDPRPRLVDLCEASYDSCTDGVDNDGDGYTDCSDRSCRRVVEQRGLRDREGNVRPGFYSPCTESGYEIPNSSVDFQTEADRCSDGVDGDSDGFVDCDDWDCQYNPVLNPSVRDRDFPHGGYCDGYVLINGQWQPSSIPRSSRPYHCE